MGTVFSPAAGLGINLGREILDKHNFLTISFRSEVLVLFYHEEGKLKTVSYPLCSSRRIWGISLWSRSAVVFKVLLIQFMCISLREEDIHSRIFPAISWLPSSFPSRVSTSFRQEAVKESHLVSLYLDLCFHPPSKSSHGWFSTGDLATGTGGGVVCVSGPFQHRVQPAPSEQRSWG